jgi:hypothetical protein
VCEKKCMLQGKRVLGLGLWGLVVVEVQGEAASGASSSKDCGCNLESQACAERRGEGSASIGKL